ncbi:MAG: hypothetical protein QOH21_128 [Acidobacteriota bacterium]|nr:hypothetical protein [Acidobacteriota bacterium]
MSEVVLRLRTRMAVGRLVARLRREQLPVARFSALGVSGVRSTMRGPADADGQTRTGELLDLAGSSSEPEAVAAAAAALAVGGSGRQAIVTLETAVASTPDDARLWSDLAAAYLEGNQPLRALVAADRALRIDARLADALYNRGLALDRLGLSMVAAETWRRCLDASPDAALATDLRERLRIAEAPSEAARWPAAQKELLRAGAAGETAVVSGLAEQFPRLVRAYAEAPYLTAWAEAVETGDAAKADEWLRIVRTTGEVLRRRGETLLSEAVGAIDEAAGANDLARVRLLAKAQRAYDRGRRAYPKRHHEEAERELRDAAATFTTARSPMAQVARAYTASVLVDRVRIDDARAILISLLDAERPIPGHRALVAMSEHVLSVCETYAGRWDAAVDASKASARIYRQLGEASNAAESEDMLGVILDLLGQPDEGWQHRIPAFRTANDAGVVNRLLVAVGTGTRAAMHANDRELALSLMDVELSLAAQVRDPSISADVLTRRVILQHERSAFDDRDNALARARIAIGAIADGPERARYSSELDTAEAVAIRDANPRRAVELLGGAIQYDRAIDRRPYLPAALLERGRAYLAVGDGAAAWKDYAAAMDELEAQRGAISDLALRSHMFDTAEELFAEALALQVQRGDAEAAFAVAERARARGLLDATGGAPRPVASSATIAGRIGPDTVVVEYAVLPEAIVVFAIGRSGLRMHRVPMKTEALSLDRADLGDLLLGAVRDDLAAAANVVFIPEKILQRVPFASLKWQGRYLVATHAISVVPSASLLSAKPALIGPKERSVLIVGNPAPNPELKLEMLPSVEREVASVGAIYRPADVLFGAEATKARFTADAPAYDVIHFAGHGVSDEESLSASLLFAARGSDAGRMYMADIEKLRLTRNPLVVLAACGTLRGRARGVEGMPSVARSFLAAGASTVVGTLWNVDDVQSGSLMTAFHRQIAAGEPPAAALRNAQLRAIARGGADADPKNWAGFVVYTVRP